MISASIVSLLTFPGVIFHEYAHRKFCDWFGVRVHKVSYFRLGDPAGYVIHDEPARFSAVFWIAFGPLVINSIVAILFSYLASFEAIWTTKWIVFLWIAICAGLHSFPSDHDVKNIADRSKMMAKHGSPLYLLAFPFVWIIYLANALRRWGFDVFYSALLIYTGFYVLPTLLSV